MSTTKQITAPAEELSLVIDFSRPEQRGYNYIHLPRHPEQMAHLIDAMDLSKVVFQGQEHGMVKRETKRKILGIISFGTKAKEIDTWRSIPNVQRYSLWR